MVWFGFILGQVLHVLKRAGYAGGGGTCRLFESSTLRFLQRNAAALVIRGVLVSVIFGFLLGDPEGFNWLLRKLSITFVWDPPRLHWTLATLLGYAADSILDWIVNHIPGLKGTVPEVMNGTSGTTPVQK